MGFWVGGVSTTYVPPILMPTARSPSKLLQPCHIRNQREVMLDLLFVLVPVYNQNLIHILGNVIFVFLIQPAVYIEADVFRTLAAEGLPAVQFEAIRGKFHAHAFKEHAERHSRSVHVDNFSRATYIIRFHVHIGRTHEIFLLVEINGLAIDVHEEIHVPVHGTDRAQIRGTRGFVQHKAGGYKKQDQHHHSDNQITDEISHEKIPGLKFKKGSAVRVWATDMSELEKLKQGLCPNCETRVAFEEISVQCGSCGWGSCA